MGSKNHTLDNVIFFSIVALLLVVGIAAFSVSIYRARCASGEAISQGWDLQIGVDAPIHDVNLETYKLPREIKKGEVITLSKDLSQTILRSETLRLFVRQSAVRVLMGNKELYSYGMDRVAEGRYVGTGYHFVDLPATNGSTRLTIYLVSSENGGLNTLPALVMSSYDVAYTTFIGENLFTVFTAVFLFVLGVALSVISLLYLALDVDYFPLVMIGFSSLLIGLWQLMYVGVLQIFAIDVSLNNTLEYLVMYFVPVPVVLQAMVVRKKQDRPILKMQLLSIACFAFAVMAVILHVLNIVHAVKMDTIYQILLIIALLLMVTDEDRKNPNLQVSGRAFRNAIYIAAGASFLDIVRFQLSIRVFPQIHLLRLSVMPVALLIFIALILYAYLSDLSTKLLKEAEREALTKLAYGDRMTGLSNRARSSVIFAELDGSDQPYAIINMDLNGLKKINDTYGHAQGDKLICAFADLVLGLFEGVGECVRMSGDEFIIAVKGDDIPRAKKLMEKLPEVEKKESAKYQFEIDASYGIAESSELKSPHAEEVYRMADRRMYEMKVESKKGRG